MLSLKYVVHELTIIWRKTVLSVGLTTCPSHLKVIRVAQEYFRQYIVFMFQNGCQWPNSMAGQHLQAKLGISIHKCALSERTCPLSEPLRAASASLVLVGFSMLSPSSVSHAFRRYLHVEFEK